MSALPIIAASIVSVQNTAENEMFTAPCEEHLVQHQEQAHQLIECISSQQQQESELPKHEPEDQFSAQPEFDLIISGEQHPEQIINGIAESVESQGKSEERSNQQQDKESQESQEEKVQQEQLIQQAQAPQQQEQQPIQEHPSVQQPPHPIVHANQSYIPYDIKKDEDYEHVCRICLESEVDKESGALAQLCDCKGSLGLLHTNCLSLQINSKLVKLQKQREILENQNLHSDFPQELPSKEKIEKDIIICELCKQPYRIELNQSLSWLPIEKARMNIKKHFKLLLGLFILFLAASAGIILVAMFMDNGSNSSPDGRTDHNAQITYFFFLGVLAIASGAGLILFTYFFLSYCLFQKISLKTIFTDKDEFVRHQRSHSVRTRATTAMSNGQHDENNARRHTNGAIVHQQELRV